MPRAPLAVAAVFGCEPTTGLSQPAGKKTEQIVAIIDLGMHCGDLDTRISSILPPFNVRHSQVILRGNVGLPQVLGEGQVDIFCSAASNPNDPATEKSIPDQALSSVTGNGGVFKTNFWDIASQAYNPFYPSGILDLFYDPNNPANNADIGLTVPDVERIYLEDGELHASQQAMPGFGLPYADNVPQVFHEHIGTLPFFLNFPFGYSASLNFFEAPGVPIGAFDDFGRENPYPLGPENDNVDSIVLNGGAIVIDSLANGRDQVKHKSMSYAMHSHHDGTGLFPSMPPAIDSAGNRRDPATTQNILEETCYLCHPGKRTQCMRGAMANGGLVCQDCHGQMQDVGDDFTRNVSPTNPGAFELGPDFYTNSAQPHVPWANEPGCGSCHTGYATGRSKIGKRVTSNAWPAHLIGRHECAALFLFLRLQPRTAVSPPITDTPIVSDCSPLRQ